MTADPAGLFVRAPELAELAALDPAVGKAVARGNPHAVYRALWWARVRGRLDERRETVEALLAHRALFVTPTRRSPVLSTVNGIGASVYGSSDRDADGTYVKTHFLVLVFVPVFPLAQYLVKDAAKGWYFLGKVPMSTPIRIWNRLVVAAIFVAVLGGVFEAVHASRFHQAHVVNGLPWPVHATIGNVAYDVPAGQRRTADIPVGMQPLRVTGPGGRPVETAMIQVDAGTDLLVWNVAGAAPIFEETVVYQAADGNADVPAGHLFCGESLVRGSRVEDAFADPPASQSIPNGQTAVYRHHVDIASGGLDVCLQKLGADPQPESGLALARTLTRLDPNGSQTGAAVRLYAALGKRDEALAVAREALVRYPDSVEHHRLYQWLFEREEATDEIVGSYKSRFEANPDSPDAAYLYVRLLPQAEGLSLTRSLAVKFPAHPLLRRVLGQLYLDDRRFPEALESFERLRTENRHEWAVAASDNVVALAGVGQRDEARKLAEEAFTRHEGNSLTLASMHTWLSIGKGPASATLLAKLASGSPTERIEMEVQFWIAPPTLSLAPLARESDRDLYRLLQDAHYQPAAAVKDVLKTRPDDLTNLDPVLLVLLLGEARRPEATAARLRLEAAGKSLPLKSVHRYLDTGVWSVALDHLPLRQHGALFLARSRTEALPAAERERLRALARDSDPVGGYVRMALAGWPPA